MKKSIHFKSVSRYFIFFIYLFITVSALSQANAAKKILTFSDIMKFKEAGKISFSEDGSRLVLEANPDRGEGEVHIYNTATGKFIIVKKGGSPFLSKNGNWTAMKLRPGIDEKYKNKKKELKPGCVLINNTSGVKTIFQKIKKFSFTSDSRYLLLLKFREKRDKKSEKKEKKKDNKAIKKKAPETDLLVIDLKTMQRNRYDFADDFSVDPDEGNAAFSISNKNGTIYSLNILEPKKTGVVLKLVKKTGKKYFSKFAWSKKKHLLAISLYPLEESPSKKNSGEILIVSGNSGKIVSVISDKMIPNDWIIPKKPRLIWSKNSYQLFIGFKPLEEAKFYNPPKKSEKKISSKKYLKINEILRRREVDIWHWNDPMINPNQKKMWNRNKKRDYLWVFNLNRKKLIKISDPGMEILVFNKNSRYAAGSASKPYMKEMTWDGRYRDLFSVNLTNGNKFMIAKKIRNLYPRISPKGKYILYYDHNNWHIFDNTSKKCTNLTGDLSISFSNEDNDYPQPAPGYGVAGWLKNDKGVLLYDKYDIWKFTFGKSPENITGGNGRKRKIVYRIIRMDPESFIIDTAKKILLTAYSDTEKDTGIASLKPGSSFITDLSKEKKKTFKFIGKAKKSDTLFITREDLGEFPDIIVTNLNLSAMRKLTNLNPQIKEFRWGKANLIRWNSIDGIPLDGVIITPEDYKGKRRLPVLVYYYRFFSQRMFLFNQMKINHRPNFPFYASNGYAVFLPDIRFEIGRPGFSATKCLVPGVQKLIEMGIADPKAIALHGHSWSGYQTAFMITQTNIFKCAIAGAPVSNMTSAYSGIRWKTGLARQFQYERSQSRLGVSLWQNITPYIENSPVFFANRINTPLLIQFGDNDGAVPWYQGIELYLAMRRLGKTCIFLQYRGEPHHLQKYPNKLDYSIKFKEYLDYYLKGTPEPEWISRGIPYRNQK